MTQPGLAPQDERNMKTPTTQQTTASTIDEIKNIQIDKGGDEYPENGKIMT